MHARVLRSLRCLPVLVALSLSPLIVSAQTAPAAKGAASDQQYASRWDIFAGYSYLAPKGTVNVPQSDGSTLPYSYDAVNVGGLFSGAYYFNRYVGAQIEYGEHYWGTQKGNDANGTHGNNDGFQTIGGGIIARYPTGHITPFVHALVDAARIDGPDHNPYTWGPALTAGGGLDYDTPWFNHHLSIRLFQADYEYMHADFGTQYDPPGGRANIDAARLSAGIVFHVGSIAPPPPVTLSCVASPSSVFPGTPITITAAPGNVNPKDSVVYSWTGPGVSGNGTTATVATGNLAPGAYSATATVKVGKKGKEGEKPWQTASCSASYTVKPFEPPTVSCSVNPTTIQPGAMATVTADGVSPQNRPLTYSYEASAGTIEGTGSTASYNSAGAPSGAVEITCNVKDDKGQTASATTSLNIVAPPVVTPHTQALCSISFATDKMRPTRVDNEAKACLDQVALSLKQNADAKALIIADSDSREKKIEAREERLHAHNRHVRVEHFAAQRAVNAKNYLVTDQGIDPSRITVLTGSTDDQSAQDYLVPAGATDAPTGTPIDETMVKPQVRKPLPMRHHHHAKM